VYGEPEPIFFAKGWAFSGGVGTCVVSMNNESFPINLQAKRKKFSENINTVVLGIQGVAFWKRVESMKSQWIPYNVHHHFWVLDGLPRSFRGLFFYAERDLLMISRRIEPRLVKDDNELPTMVFDGPELAQGLN
jgi:hypothetical protein